MISNVISDELAHATYFFTNFIFFGIVFSIFYSIKNGVVRSRRANRIVGTRHVLVVFFIMVTMYYLGDRLLSEKIISFISDLGDTTIPLSVLSISLVALYMVKVVMGRRWRFPYTKSTLIVSITSFAFTFFMIINENRI